MVGMPVFVTVAWIGVCFASMSFIASVRAFMPLDPSGLGQWFPACILREVPSWSGNPDADRADQLSRRQCPQADCAMRRRCSTA